MLLHRYLPFGRNAGLVGGDKKQGVEGYTVRLHVSVNLILLLTHGAKSFPETESATQASMLGNSACQRSYRSSPLLANFMNQLHEIGLHVLNALDQSDNGFKGGEGLASVHRSSEPSTTCLMLQRYPCLSSESPNAGLRAHTDVGSITILFCGERGLQVMNPMTEEWKFLEPKEGCAVINVGDSLRFLSDKTYQSALHRVVPHPGTTIENRFSCAYFVRPELDAEFVDEEGKRWKSINWHMRKYKGYRKTENSN